MRLVRRRQLVLRGSRRARPWLIWPLPVWIWSIWIRPGCCRPPHRGSRSGLPVGFRQPCLADALLDPDALAMTGQRAGSRRAAPPPEPDKVADDAAGGTARPDQFERREQPPAIVSPQDAARHQLAG